VRAAAVDSSVATGVAATPTAAAGSSTAKAVNRPGFSGTCRARTGVSPPMRTRVAPSDAAIHLWTESFMGIPLEIDENLP